VLHPADGWERQPQLLGALELAQYGKIAESSEILSRLRTAQNFVGRFAALQYFRINGRWEECLAWMREAPIAAQQDLSFVMIYLRALGETGDLNGMLAVFERAEKQMDAAGIAGQICRLFALAFCGREQIAALFRGPLGVLPG